MGARQRDPEEAGLVARAGAEARHQDEIDTRPPEGWRSERRVVTRYVTFLVAALRIALAATGSHAAPTRPYAKGRDWARRALGIRHSGRQSSRTWPLPASTRWTRPGTGQRSATRGERSCRTRSPRSMRAVGDDVRLPFGAVAGPAAPLTRENLLAVLEAPRRRNLSVAGRMRAPVDCDYRDWSTSRAVGCAESLPACVVISRLLAKAGRVAGSVPSTSRAPSSTTIKHDLVTPRSPV